MKRITSVTAVLLICLAGCDQQLGASKKTDSNKSEQKSVAADVKLSPDAMTNKPSDTRDTFSKDLAEVRRLGGCMFANRALSMILNSDTAATANVAMNVTRHQSVIYYLLVANLIKKHAMPDGGVNQEMFDASNELMSKPRSGINMAEMVKEMSEYRSNNCEDMQRYDADVTNIMSNQKASYDDAYKQFFSASP